MFYINVCIYIAVVLCDADPALASDQVMQNKAWE